MLPSGIAIFSPKLISGRALAVGLQPLDSIVPIQYVMGPGSYVTFYSYLKLDITATARNYI